MVGRVHWPSNPRNVSPVMQALHAETQCKTTCWNDVTRSFCPGEEHATTFKSSPCYRTPQGCGDLQTAGQESSEYARVDSGSGVGDDGFPCHTLVRPRFSAAALPGWVNMPRPTPRLVRDMEHIGMWEEQSYDEIVKSHGCVDGIDGLPAVIKARYNMSHAAAACRASPTDSPWMDTTNPAGEKLEREFYAKSMEVKSDHDPASGLRVSTLRAHGVTGRMLPQTASSHSVLHAAFPEDTPDAWPQPDPDEFPSFYKAKGHKYVHLPAVNTFLWLMTSCPGFSSFGVA